MSIELFGCLWTHMLAARHMHDAQHIISLQQLAVIAHAALLVVVVYLQEQVQQFGKARRLLRKDQYICVNDQQDLGSVT
jgi:hypothetical protein